MQTTTKISESKKKLTNFHTFGWRASSPTQKNENESFWQVRTNFRKEKFIRYMKLKHLYVGLSTDELQFLVDSPGVLGDNIFISALRAKREGVPLDILGERYRFLYSLGIISTENTQNLLYTYDGSIKFQIFRTERAIAKFKKFSGYVRNSSAVGSKRKTTNSYEPEHFEWDNALEYDYYLFFSVGELNTGKPGSSSLILKSPNRTKRKKQNSKMFQ